MRPVKPKKTHRGTEAHAGNAVVLVVGAAILLAAGMEFFPSSSLVMGVRIALLLAAAIALFFLSRQAERGANAPAAEEGEFQSIVRGFRDALIVYDQSFKVLFINKAAEKLFGIAADSFVGREVKPELGESQEFRLLVQVLFPSLAPMVVSRSPAGTYPQVSDLSFSEPPLELRVTTGQVTSLDGTPIGFMKIIQDRTREVSLVKSKEEFITVASHQLRTPVNELQWALESLQNETQLSDEGKKTLERSLRSARALADLIENLLNISKIEEGRFGYSFVETDLTSFLEGILGDLLLVAERSGVKLYFDRPKESLPKVSIDPKKLSMVVFNLVDNAIRYNVKQGDVTVRIQKSTSGPYLETTIQDTGIGIPPEEVPKLFNKFFRARNAVKFATEGSGLGLYIARNIVRAHGGDVWLESEVERGTTVHFTLPVDPTLIPPKEVAMEY